MNQNASVFAMSSVNASLYISEFHTGDESQLSRCIVDVEFRAILELLSWDWRYEKAGQESLDTEVGWWVLPLPVR